MNKKIIALVLLAVVLALAGFAVYRAVRFSIQEKREQRVSIQITKDGFLPQTLKIKAGTTVFWVNNDQAPHGIGANPYPDNSELPDLKSDALGPGDTYSFRFDKPGSYNYHDNTNPLTNGTIEVE